jgi:hypothetical protein
MVLCVEEKSQIQALDRTQPGLPMQKGRCQTMTHDYKGHGTTTLFAALELAQAKVVGEVLSAPPPSGIFEVSPPLRRRVSWFRSFTSGDGQLWHPQQRRSPSLAEKAPAFPTASAEDL